MHFHCVAGALPPAPCSSSDACATTIARPPTHPHTLEARGEACNTTAAMAKGRTGRMDPRFAGSVRRPVRASWKKTARAWTRFAKRHKKVTGARWALTHAWYPCGCAAGVEGWELHNDSQWGSDADAAFESLRV